MPLKPDPRAAASRQLGDAHEAALEALLLPDGPEQVAAWRKAAHLAQMAEWKAMDAVREAVKQAEKRKK